MAMNGVIFYLRDPFDRTMERGLELFCSKIPSKRDLFEKIQFVVSTFFYFITSPLSVALFGIAGVLDSLKQRCSNVSFTRLEGSAPIKEGEPAKIATFNVCMLFGGLGIKFGGQDLVSTRIARVAKKIIESGADVVCLQEVSPPAARLLFRELEKVYRFGIERINPDPWLTLDSGLFVVSKLRIQNPQVILIPLAARMKRALFTFQTGSMKIGTTHLEPGNEAPDIVMRKRQVGEILKHEIDVLMGDLNVERGTEFQESGLAGKFYDGFRCEDTTTDGLSIDYILAKSGTRINSDFIDGSDCSDHHMLMNC